MKDNRAMEGRVASNFRIVLAALAGSAWCLAVLDRIFSAQLSSRVTHFDEVRTWVVAAAFVYALGGAVLMVICGRFVETEFRRTPLASLGADIFFFACLTVALRIMEPNLHSESVAHIVPGLFLFDPLNWAVPALGLPRAASFLLTYNLHARRRHSHSASRPLSSTQRRPIRRRVNSFRMSVTVLSGMAYGLLVGLGFLGRLHDGDLWMQTAPRVVPAFLLGGGILGLIYARHIEAHLRAGDPILAEDITFTILAMIIPNVFLNILGMALYFWEGTTIFFMPLLLAMFRFASIAVEERRRRKPGAPCLYEPDF